MTIVITMKDLRINSPQRKGQLTEKKMEIFI